MYFCPLFSYLIPHVTLWFLWNMRRNKHVKCTSASVFLWLSIAPVKAASSWCKVNCLHTPLPAFPIVYCFVYWTTWVIYYWQCIYCWWTSLNSCFHNSDLALPRIRRSMWFNKHPIHYGKANRISSVRRCPVSVMIYLHLPRITLSIWISYENV